jgi:hypothetical protein
MPRSLVPAEREIASSAFLVAEMCRYQPEPDERLVAAGIHLEHALGLVADFVSGVPLRARETDTVPAPPPASTAPPPPLETLSEGAE